MPKPKLGRVRGPVDAIHRLGRYLAICEWLDKRRARSWRGWCRARGLQRLAERRYLRGE